MFLHPPAERKETEAEAENMKQAERRR